MRIAIIDDDRRFINVLKRELLKVYSNAEIDMYSDASLDIFDNEFDIIFLDVMLGLEKSFEYGEKILDLYTDTPLVYMSSLNDFVYDSIRQNSFFFIRKDRLRADLIDLNNKYQQYLLNQFSTISIREKNEKKELLQRDIIYIESNKNRINIYTECRDYIVYMSLKSMMKLLDEKNFYRLNSFIIINFKHVLHYDKKRMIMSNGVEIKFTRNSERAFTNAYLKYRGSKIWNG